MLTEGYADALTLASYITYTKQNFFFLGFWAKKLFAPLTDFRIDIKYIIIY